MKTQQRPVPHRFSGSGRFCIFSSFFIDFSKNVFIITIVIYLKLFKEDVIMPPKVKVTRENILSACVDIIRESGFSAVNARALAQRLGCSTQPIFSNYESMEALKKDALAYAEQVYQNYLLCDMQSGEFPPYKASGMAYIRFAREEKELFRLLFMRDRTGESIQEGGEIAGIVELLQKSTGLSRERAYLFHIEMWIYVHGIATMCATSYLDWDREMISLMLTDAYKGLSLRYSIEEDTQ